jgi:orotate phosphoribosyltransferase
MLAEYQRSFLDFALEQGVMRFGEFTLKSGRTSPYFFNAGQFNSGVALKRLGEYYADALVASSLSCDCLFGPAYKGIPLVATTVIAMAERYQLDIPYVFNRKEVKDHGEGGQLVGAELAGDVIIVDDVITAGTAIREVMSLFATSDAKVSGVMVAIDRQERGRGELSAIQEVERDYGVPVISVVNLSTIVTYLQEKGTFRQEIAEISSYRDQYGIASS